MASKRTILLIDYDPESIEQTRAPLVRAGYRVEVAGDGQSGIEAFATLGPDLVLIEPMVPKLHGFQVCREIKSTPRGRNTPVLITTAFYRGRKHRSEAEEQYGCDGYLEKPIAEALLLSTCSKFLIDMQQPPLPSGTVSADPGPGTGSPRTTSSSVISFPDLPLREDREPSRFVALDDLSDEEIQARLDHMILEDGPPDSPRDTAASPRTGSVGARLPGREQVDVPAHADRPPSTAAAAPVQPPGPRPSPRSTASPPALDSPATRRERVPDRVERPASRPADPRRSAPASRRSARALGVGLAALACLLSGAGLLWWLGRGEGTPPGELAGRSPEPTVSRPAARPVEPPEPPVAANPESATTPPGEPSQPTGTDAAAITVAEGRGEEPAQVESRTAAQNRPGGVASTPDRPKPAGRVVSDPPATRETSIPEPSRAVPPPPARTSSPEPRSATPPSEPASRERMDSAPGSDETETTVPPVLPEARDAVVDSAAPATVVVTPEEPGPTEARPPSVRPGELLPLEQVDVAPRPVRRRAPEYPAMARRLRQEGTVVLRMLVDETGRVDQVEIESGNKLLQQAAVAAAKEWSFDPATKDGVPVKVWITEAMKFAL